MKNGSAWPEISLHEICRPTQWPTIPQAALVSDGYPVYGANGKIGYYTEFNHEHPTVLITCRGATCGTINVCEPRSYVTGNAMALDDLQESRVSREYLVYALRKVGLQKAISGTAQPQITRQGLTAISIPLPSIADQRRIAAILDKADELRAKRRRIFEKLEMFSQAIFIEWFGDPLRNPKNWPLVRFGDEVMVQGGFAFKSEDYAERGVRLVRISNVHKDLLSWDEIVQLPAKYLEAFRSFSLMHGDIVVALTRPIIKSLNSVKIAVVQQTDLPALLNQRVARFSFRKGARLLPEYVLGFCRSKAFFNAVQRFCSESLQPNMSTGQIESIEIACPPMELQMQYAQSEAIVARIKEVDCALVEASGALFLALQHRAFRGEL